MSTELERRSFGVAGDGRRFNIDSQEVQEFLDKYPSVSLDAAIGSVLEIYNRLNCTSVSNEECTNTQEEPEGQTLDAEVKA